MNTWAVSVLRHGGGITNWTKAELENMYRKTWKRIITPSGECWPLVPSKTMRWSWADQSWGLRACRRDRLVQLSLMSRKVSNHYLWQWGMRDPQVQRKMRLLSISKRWRWKRDWKAKELHGQILRQTEDVKDEASRDWMMREDLKKDTEGLITAAQDQALRTNVIKAKIEKTAAISFM